jgi:3-methyladenine DNA glycosylase AlkD
MAGAQTYGKMLVWGDGSGDLDYFCTINNENQLFKLVDRLIDSLRQQLLTASTSEKKAGMEAYMRNQFTFIGVDTVPRRAIFKEWIKSADLPDYADLPVVIKEMWQMERELQYCAIELAALYKKEWTTDFMATIEHCIITRSWWDTVDAIASTWIGPYFKRFPAEIKSTSSKWNRNKNIWLQRSSIMFQKQFKKDTDTALLTKYILRCAASNEFFIQKAIGWALREYGKTNPAWVRDFVVANELKPLSKREALKNL